LSEPKKKTPEWVTCEHCIGLLQEYVDGTLPADEKEALDRHIKACPPCVDFVRKYKATPNLCKQALAEEIPEELGDRLSAFLHAKCTKHE
jgi:anti-sigma factor RsiW